MGIPEARPNDGPRKRTWPLALAVLLAIGGLQYLSSGPDPADWDVQEPFMSPDPFPAIPDGKAGAVSLVPCGDSMDCGYVMYVSTRGAAPPRPGLMCAQYAEGLL
jgi:hypothetical protein